MDKDVKGEAPIEPAAEAKTAAQNNSKDSSGGKAKAAKAVAGIAALVLVASGAYAGYVFMNKDKDTETKNDKADKTEPSSLRLENNELSDFDLEFLKLENSNENKAYSPMSIKYALSMLKDGSDGETKDEIEALIGDYNPTAYVNTKNRSIANALFVNEEYKDEIHQEYIDGIKDKYVASLLFDTFDDAGKINNWISDNTNNLINNMVPDDQVKPDETKFMLVNALSIDMNWNYKIQCSRENEDINIPDEVPSMSYWVNYAGIKYNDSQLCRGDFGSDTMTFDNQEGVSALRFSSSINKYDIIGELGEDHIREVATEDYKAYYEDWMNDPANQSSIEAGLKEIGEVDETINKYMENIKNNNGYNTAETSTDYQYYTDDSVKVFAKDLKEYEGTTLQYVGIMPTNEDLTTYIENTKTDDIKTIIENLKNPDVQDSEDGVITQIKGVIPEFDFDYKLKLKDDLENLGVKQVFEPGEADLSKLTSAKLTYIQDASHKTKIEFSNNGIKAAAATVATGGAGSALIWNYEFEAPIKKIDLTFDKPYLFLIRDKKTGEIWFTGTVYKPLTK